MSHSVLLGDHISTQKGFAFKSKWFVDIGRDIVKVSDFTSNSISSNGLMKISEDLGEQYSRYALSTGDVIIQTVGSWPSNPASVVGKTVRVPKAVNGALLNQNAVKITPQETIHQGFLYYLLRSDDFKNYIIGTAQGAASQASITLDAIKRYKFKLPTFQEQEAIAGYLENYDNLIENNQCRIAILEEMVQSLYSEWFVNFRYPGHKDNLDDNGNSKLVDSPLGQIPEGWELKRVKDLGTVITGKTPSKKKAEYYASSDVPFLKTPDMHGSIFSVDIDDYLSNEGANSQKNKFIPENSICVACIGAKAGVVTMASEKLQTNQQINSLVLDDSGMREYFYLFSVGLHQKIHALGSSGATMTNVSKSKFEGIEVIVPPTSIIEDFHKATGASFDLILNLQKRNKNLKRQRDMLLPKLIFGDIEL